MLRRATQTQLWVEIASKHSVRDMLDNSVGFLVVRRTILCLDTKAHIEAIGPLCGLLEHCEG